MSIAGEGRTRMSATQQQFCTFYIQGLLFGVEVKTVQEVIRHQEMTGVPLAPEVVAGLINLRGQIVTAIDLRRRLGVRDRLADELPMNVVVRTADGAVSLLVDEIGDVVEVEEKDFEEAPDTLASTSRELIRGVYKLKKELLLVLDTQRSVNISALAGESGRGVSVTGTPHVGGNEDGRKRFGSRSHTRERHGSNTGGRQSDVSRRCL